MRQGSKPQTVQPVRQGAATLYHSYLEWLYEHTVRDEDELQRCVDYVYFNPVKHGWVSRVGDWPYSSFHRDVRQGLLVPDWGGSMAAAVMNMGE